MWRVGETPKVLTARKTQELEYPNNGATLRSSLHGPTRDVGRLGPRNSPLTVRCVTRFSLISDYLLVLRTDSMLVASL